MLAEKLNHILNQQPVRVHDESREADINVSISIGIAWFDKTDKADGGRNRTCLA